jgi:tetratricopeptide (TPR) repeat protein
VTRKAPAQALHEALSSFAAGYLEDATRACRKIARAQPGLPDPHLLLVEIHRQIGDEVRARESVARILRLRPAWSEAHIYAALGDLLNDLRRYGEAEERYRSALAIQPGLADARYNLASALYAAGRVADAITELLTLLRSDPGAADAREQLIWLLQEQRRFDEMAAVCREGMELHPASSFYPNKLGVALWWRGRHDEAMGAYRLAAERAGDSHSEAYEAAKFLEASALLTLGRYAEGWDAYRWRHTRRVLRASHPELVDDPRVIAALSSPKRLRILCEQGLGDELFFLRFAPALRDRGHRLTISCNPKLAPLLASMPNFLGSDQNPDFTLASGDLPLASGQSFAPPLPVPVDVERRNAMEARLRAFGPPPYIGVTWRAGVLPDEPKPEGRLYFVKDVPAELLGRALRSLDARVIVVQRRPQPDEMRRFSEALGSAALDISEANDDLRDAVALLSLLNEYVGVSNTNMHLRAGLEAKSARVLVLTPPEWRWGLHGPLSPWFPASVLYRQDFGKDWTDALGRLRCDLGEGGAALQQI